MGMVSGSITVAVAGTPVPAPHKGNVRVVLFKARSANVGAVYVGGADVSAGDGLALEPDDAVTLEFPDPVSTSQFYADAATGGDSVDFMGVD